MVESRERKRKEEILFALTSIYIVVLPPSTLIPQLNFHQISLFGFLHIIVILYFEGFAQKVPHSYSDCQLCARRIFFSFIFMHYGYCHERNGDDDEIMSRGRGAGNF